MTIRIVLADDHPIVLDGLTQLFAAEADCQVVGRAANGEEALRAVRELRPDVLVLDLRMPRKDGLTVLREMKGDALPTRVVLLTAMDNDDVVHAIRLGVRGIMLKDMASRLLVQCVRAVYAGGKWLEKGHATQMVDTLLGREAGMHDIVTTLTPREREVAHMIAKGMHNKAIARKLSIGEGTAKLHLHHVYKKLNVDGRLGLMQYMQRRGLA
jgi:DNA-binding NarL/FixJ family response regulator